MIKTYIDGVLQGFVNANEVNYNNSTSGLTSTNVQTAIDEVTEKTKYNSFGTVKIPTITKNVDGTITIGNNGIFNFCKSANGDDLIVRKTLTGTTLTPTNNTINYLYADYNNGSPIYALTLSPSSFLTDARYCPITRITREGTVLHFEEYDQYGVALSNKLLYKDITINASQRQSGLILSTSATRIASVTSGSVWFGVQNYNCGTVTSGSIGNMFEYYLVGGVWNKSNNQNSFDSTYYSDGTNRQTMTANRYVAKYFWRDAGNDNEIYYIHGNQYTSASSALAEVVPTAPSAMTAHSIYVGKIVIQQGATLGTAYPRLWEGAVATASATNHEDLTNILQAGTGVANGHISDGTQTIYGAKTFNTPMTSTTANLTNSTNKNLVTDVEKTAITHSNRTALDNISGTNTGDETTSTILTKIGDGSKINSTYLPSYVDDVLEYASLANFPATGEDGKIYVALNTNLTYRWSGSAYVEISPSLALGETSTTAYRGDRGASAYAHSIITDGSNPHSTTFANIASKPTTIAGYGITDGALQGVAYSNLENNVKIVQGVPAGGKMHLGIALRTGAIKIKLPKAKSNAMFKFRVKMNGQLENKISSSEYIVKGYNSGVGMGNTTSNVNTTQQVTVIKDNASTMSPTFYFCTGATEDYVLIGEITDIHNHKSVVIDDVEIHHAGISEDWSKDWAISLVTTLETLTSQYKVAVTPSLNATHLNGVQETTTGENGKLVKTSATGRIDITQPVAGFAGVSLNNTSGSNISYCGYVAKADNESKLYIYSYSSGRTQSLFGKVIANKTGFFSDGADSTGILFGTLTNTPITIGVNNVSKCEIDSSNAIWSVPVTSTQYKLSALNTAPASATATGTTGEIRIDANYIYVCTATNTWKRTALTTW